MTATALQTRLTAVVLADPDVHTIYPPRSERSEIARRLLSSVSNRQSQPPSVTVSETGDGTMVVVSVGVTGEHPATTVCRNLHDRLAAELDAAGASFPVSIAVNIASIV